MADEIQVTTNVLARKGGLNVLRNFTSKIDMAGAAFNATLQTVGLTPEALSIGDIGTAGVCLLYNSDVTNYVEVGRLDGSLFYGVIKLMPGEHWLIRCATNSLYAKANTAPVKMEVWLLEN